MPTVRPRSVDRRERAENDMVSGRPDAQQRATAERERLLVRLREVEAAIAHVVMLPSKQRC